MTGDPTRKLPIAHHLQELRRRLLATVAVVIAGGVIGYLYRGELIALLQRPLGEKLFYTSPMGSFNFVMQLCLLVGFLIALPVLTFNLLRFIEPAFQRTFGSRTVVGVITASLALTIAGAAFAYYVSLPAALHFFGTVGTGSLQPLISIDQYFSFVLSYLATFAIVFQLPLLLLFVNRITPLGPGALRKWRKFVFVGAFAIAIIIPSAPDPLSQVILALPIILLYEISIALIWIANRKRNRSRASAQTAPSVARVVTPPPTRQVVPTAVPTGRVLDLRNHRPVGRDTGMLDLRTSYRP